MQRYEYRVLPAPKKGKKARGLRSADERFALALSETMNSLAADGWEYLRTDTLPAEERSGIAGRTTVFQNMLVFRRELSLEDTAPVPLGDAADAERIAELHAPKLPSATAAQTVPDEPAAAPAAGEERSDKPAHAAE